MVTVKAPVFAGIQKPVNQAQGSIANVPNAVLAANSDKLEISSAKQDVSFTGLSNFIKSKPGKLGIIGTALLALLGTASVAKAHRVYSNDGTQVEHKHVFQGGVEYYRDRFGNVRTRSYDPTYRLDPGSREYQRVDGGWQEIRRVYDGNSNNWYDTEYGNVVPDLRQYYPGLPNLELNTPGFRLVIPWGVFIKPHHRHHHPPRPHHWDHRPPHHHHHNHPPRRW